MEDLSATNGINEIIAKANLDPKLAAKLEVLSLRIHAAGAFTDSHKRLESIFQAYKQKYESEAGTQPDDLRQAKEDISNLLAELTRRIRIDPMLEGGEPQRQTALQLLEDTASLMNPEERNELVGLAGQDLPERDAGQVRRRSLETRDGVTEVLWELATTYEEEATAYSVIPKPVQDDLFKELDYAYGLSTELLSETAAWLEPRAQNAADKPPATGE